MTIQLQPNHSLSKRTTQIVRHEIDAALRRLAQPPGADTELDEIVHDVRKRFKKVRAVLRLLRSCIGVKTYRRENVAFRETARLLCDVRDAQALLEVLDKLMPQLPENLSLRACADLREVLENRQHALSDQLRGPVPVSDQVTRSLRKSCGRLRNWNLKRLNWSGLQRGLKHVFMLGQRAFRIAKLQPTPECLHEWRKQVKYFSNQLQTLKPVWRKAKNELGRELEKLTDILGEDHDLARLIEAVEAEASKQEHDTDLEDLLLAIEERRRELEQHAFKLGQSIYGKLRKPVLRQIERWWKADS